MTDLNAIAKRMDDAQRNAKAVAQLSEPVSMADAYTIQRASMSLRYARGEKQVGIKLDSPAAPKSCRWAFLT